MKNTLTAKEIKSASDGKLFDGGGLQLRKKGQGGKWVFRYSHLGRRREMGLGTYPAVSLADARKLRDRWQSCLTEGKDPIDQRNHDEARERELRDRTDPTFEEMVNIVFEARKATLRGDGKRGQWINPLRNHVIPHLRKRMSEIQPIDIRDALKPIWQTMPPTAKKAIMRTKIVFRDARLMGFECDPFTVDSARHMLGEVHHEPKHILSTPWQEMPALYHSLSLDASSHRCLRFLMLTLVRGDAGRGARASEIDGDVWTVPPERIKGRRGKVQPFRVPLTASALQIVDRSLDFSEELLFPNPRKNTPITSRGIEVALDRLGEQGRPHGFRASFRTWVQETQPRAWEAAETILQHSIGNKVERTYARSDLLDQRRALMMKWEAFLIGSQADIIPIRSH